MTSKKLMQKYQWLEKQKYKVVGIRNVIADLQSIQRKFKTTRNGSKHEN